MEELKNAFHNYQLQFEPSVFRNRRDELVSEFEKEINIRRINTKYKLITTKEIALRINANPKFTGQDGEIALLLKSCIEKNSFSKFFYCCPIPITRYVK